MVLISELSRKTGVPVATIRYYEQYGLFNGKKQAAVRSNNYSWYDGEVEDKLALILEAKAIGFSLAEIKSLVDAWHSRRFTVEKKVAVLTEKIHEIDTRIQSLKQMKKTIAECIVDVRKKGF